MTAAARVDTGMATRDDLEKALGESRSVTAYLQAQLDAPADGERPTVRQQIRARRLDMLREPDPVVITGTRETVMAAFTKTLAKLDRDDLFCLHALAQFALDRNRAAERAAGKYGILTKLRDSHSCKKSTEPLFIQGPRKGGIRQWTCLSCHKPVEMRTKDTR